MKPNTVYEARDIFVRFRDMLLYIALRWKSILLIALAVAVLAAGVKFWQDTNRYNSIEKAPEETETEPLDDEGQAHVEAVRLLDRNHELLCTYNTTAPMMKIDFQSVPTQKMSYLVTGSRSYAAALMYREGLADEMLYQKLAKSLSTDEQEITAAHLAELVTIELKKDNNENNDCVFVEVTVIAPTKKMCTSLANTVRDAIESIDDVVYRQVGYSTGNWVFDRYGAVLSNSVLELQKERWAAQEQARKELKDATDALTAEEEDYLFVRDKEEKPTLTYPVPTVSKSMLVLGFIGGVLLMALWHGLRYLYCGRVLSSVEMEVRHGLPTFGALAGTKKRFIVDRWLRGCLQDKDVTPFLLWHRMALTAKNAGYTSVYLVGDPERLEGLTDVMTQQGITLQIGDSPLSSPEALSALSQNEAVILTADLEITRHQTVADEMELAQQLGCTVLGALLIKE